MRFQVSRRRSNNSFKPTPHRGVNSVLCATLHAVATPLRGGLTQALGLMESDSDFQAFKQALIAAAQGPFFPDWEFHTLFGFNRADVHFIAESFSPTTEIAGDVALAINSAIGNLIGYPHGKSDIWSKWLSVTPAELEAIHSRWRAVLIEA
jgi:hypothetical protein